MLIASKARIYISLTKKDTKKYLFEKKEGVMMNMVCKHAVGLGTNKGDT